MRIDIVDVSRRKPCLAQCHPHRQLRALALWMRRGDVIGIARQAIAYDFGIDFRAARLGMLIFLKHHHACTFAHHKAIAILVIRAAGRFGAVIEAGIERTCLCESGNAQRVDGAFGTPRQHDVGIIIPYYIVLRNIGWIDSYQGIILIYLSFSLPFAIWLLVSYFEDIPYEMEEAAYLDGASRLRTLWRIIIPQVRGGIAVTVVFVFLNAWNEFLFAVVLSGNTVRPVTIAMFNFVSVEQTLWAKLAAVSVLAMLPVVILGIVAQKHIVKGLTVGAVKGGGRR